MENHYHCPECGCMLKEVYKELDWRPGETHFFYVCVNTIYHVFRNIEKNGVYCGLERLEPVGTFFNRV